VLFLSQIKLKDSEPCPCGSNISFQDVYRIWTKKCCKRQIWKSIRASNQN